MVHDYRCEQVYNGKTVQKRLVSLKTVYWFISWFAFALNNLSVNLTTLLLFDFIVLLHISDITDISIWLFALTSLWNMLHLNNEVEPLKVISVTSEHQLLFRVLSGMMKDYPFSFSAFINCIYSFVTYENSLIEVKEE